MVQLEELDEGRQVSLKSLCKEYIGFWFEFDSGSKRMVASDLSWHAEGLDEAQTMIEMDKIITEGREEIIRKMIDKILSYPQTKNP